MRKVPVLTGVTIGAALGLCTSIFDSGGLKIVMMLIGALAGTAAGSAMSRARGRLVWRTFQQSPLTDAS